MKQPLSIIAFILMLALSLTSLISCDFSELFSDETTETEPVITPIPPTRPEYPTIPPAEETPSEPAKEKISIKFYEHDVEAHKSCTLYKFNVVRAELASGAWSCNDGVITEYQCNTCAYGYTLFTKNGDEHPMVTREVDIDAVLAANKVPEHSHVGWLDSCPCGERRPSGVSFNYPNSVILDGAKYTTCKYAGCKLRAGIEDIVHDKLDDKCMAEQKGTYKLYFGDELLAEAPYMLYEEEFHNYKTEYALVSGTSTCNYGGVIVSYTCRRCGEHYTERPNSGNLHNVAPRQYISLDKAESICKHHSMYTTTCLCVEDKVTKFNTGYGLSKSNTLPDYYYCYYCDLTLTMEKSSDESLGENCYKYTIREGDTVINEIYLPSPYIDMTFEYDP